jgi:hypothetical protein
MNGTRTGELRVYHSKAILKNNKKLSFKKILVNNDIKIKYTTTSDINEDALLLNRIRPLLKKYSGCLTWDKDLQ